MEIPKIIHQIWIGKSIPPIIDLYMSTFRKQKGFKYRLWSNEDITPKNFPITYKYIKRLLSRKKVVYAMISDLMRLEILYHHGGIYVDTTMECVKSLKGILKSKSPFIMSNEETCGLKCRGEYDMLFISNSFIASIPKYKVLERLLSEKYLKSIDFKLPANIATGPYYVRKGIKRHNEVKMLPTKNIYPFHWEEEDPSISLEKRKGFKKVKYNDEKQYYIKFPCSFYNNDNVYIIKHWSVGGTWLKK
jgi:mannosyltransferase OCH1-like enzyme